MVLRFQRIFVIIALITWLDIFNSCLPILSLICLGPVYMEVGDPR